MDVDGHFYIQDVTEIEVQRVTKDLGTLVRVRFKGTSDTALAFACWGPDDGAGNLIQPTVTIIDRDEREHVDAIVEHEQESDR